MVLLGRLRCGSADAAAADRSLNRRNLDLAMREWARLHRDTAGTGDEEALARVGSFMMSIGQVRGRGGGGGEGRDGGQEIVHHRPPIT